MPIDDRGYDSEWDGRPPAVPPPVPPTAWAFAGACYGSTDPFPVQGVDVWHHQWSSAGGPDAAVVDPNHGQPYTFPVYRVTVEGRPVVFAAGEFSNGVWGFYVPAPPTPPRPSVWRRLAPYVPLIAVGVQVPWTVLVVMAHIGGGPDRYQSTPQQVRAFAAELIVPTVVGLLVGGYALVRRWVATPAQWTCLSIGCLLCGLVCYGLGWTQAGAVQPTPPPGPYSTPNPPPVDRIGQGYTPPPPLPAPPQWEGMAELNRRLDAARAAARAATTGPATPPTTRP